MWFAMKFLTLGIATIVQRVRFELESDPEPGNNMAVTFYSANDVEIRVRKCWRSLSLASRPGRLLHPRFPERLVEVSRIDCPISASPRERPEYSRE